MKILVVFGTRPEAIKTAPVILALRQQPEWQVKVCFTGQHRDLAMPFMTLFGIESDFNFTIRNTSLCDSVAEILQQMDDLLSRERPDWVLVQGDTNTVLAASLAAFYHHIKIGHIEAGLRTHRKFFPFPEEMNRLLTTRLADLHFAPTDQARENLCHDGVPDSSILVTGNTVIDALRLIFRKIETDSEYDHRLQKRFQFLDSGKKLILLTGHRRENQDGGLAELCHALQEIVAEHDDVQIIYPVHPSPKVRECVYALLQNKKNIHLEEPLDYLNFIQLLRRSFCVMTDSGGVQEEAAALGKPIVLLRNETERPEIAKMTRVVAVGTYRPKIVRAVASFFEKSENAEGDTSLLGDGEASARIVKGLRDHSETTG